MTKMKDEEVQDNFKKYPHLKKYFDNIKKKMDEPVFYSILPMDIKGEGNPNLIYAAQGSVFIHVYKTKDMDEIEYHAIEPELDENEQIKHDKLLKLIVKKAPEKDSIITDEELRDILKELIDEVLVIDENAVEAKKEKKSRFTKTSKSEKIKATSIQKENIEHFIIKNIVGTSDIECFMRDPYIEDIHIISGEKIHLIHKIFSMIKTNIEIPKDTAQLFARKLS